MKRGAKSIFLWKQREVNILIDLKRIFDTVGHSILMNSYLCTEIKVLHFNGSNLSEQ